MFKVRDMRNGTVWTVYAVIGNFFLLFVDGKWCVDAMDLYVPVEE